MTIKNTALLIGVSAVTIFAYQLGANPSAFERFLPSSIRTGTYVTLPSAEDVIPEAVVEVKETEANASIDVAVAVEEEAVEKEPTITDNVIKAVKGVKAPTYGAHEKTLSNGMRVIVIPNHRAPVVTHMVWYRVGAADEPWGISGSAHYLEHLLFKGTAKYEPGEFSKNVKLMGGNGNAFTSWDYTAYFQSIPSEHLKEVMVMEADRMRGANPPQEHFLSERKVVLEERRQTLDNKPSAKLAEQARQALYVNHPYGRPIIGWMHEVAALEWPEIKKFYDRWYSPKNATLIVAGDVEPEAFFKQAEEIYGGIEPFDVPESVRPAVPDYDSKKVITLRDKSVKQRSFYRMALAPSMAQDVDLQNAMSVIGVIMDGGATSRFYKSLIVDQKIAVGASLSYNGGKRDQGTLSYGGTPVDGVSLDALEDAILAEIKKAAEGGFTQEELDRAKARMLDSFIFERDSVTGPAMIFGHALMAGATIDQIEYWPHMIEAVTLEQINEVARKYLNVDEYWTRSVYGYLLPEDAPVIEKNAAKEGEK